MYEPGCNGIMSTDTLNVNHLELTIGGGKQPGTTLQNLKGHASSLATYFL